MRACVLGCTDGAWISVPSCICYFASVLSSQSSLASLVRRKWQCFVTSGSGKKGRATGDDGAVGGKLSKLLDCVACWIKIRCSKREPERNTELGYLVASCAFTFEFLEFLGLYVTRSVSESVGGKWLSW